MADIAKVFQSGGSQAIRLPKQYRFDDDEVLIYREGNRVILESRRAEWSEQFLRLAGTAAEFSCPDEPSDVEPGPALGR
jgi:antitoxin VapB